MFLQLSFETLKQRDRIGGRAGKSRNDLIVVESPRFSGGVLDDVVAHGHLSIGDQHNFVFLPDAQNRCAVNLRLSRSVTHSFSIPRHPGPVIFAKLRGNSAPARPLIGQGNFPEGKNYVGRWRLRGFDVTSAVVNSRTSWIGARLAETGGPKRR